MCSISTPRSIRLKVYGAGQPTALTPIGGGGTNFAPCVQWLDERGIVPQTLVFLTDLWGEFPKWLLLIRRCGPLRSRDARQSGR